MHIHTQISEIAINVSFTVNFKILTRYRMCLDVRAYNRCARMYVCFVAFSFLYFFFFFQVFLLT